MSALSDYLKLLNGKPLAQSRARTSLMRPLSHDGRVETRAMWVEELVRDGWKVETHSVVDTRERKRLEEYIERNRRTVPFGNDKHPQTIAFNEAQAALAAGPRVDQRRLVSPTGTFLIEPDLSKTAIDYAEHLIAKATP